MALHSGGELTGTAGAVDEAEPQGGQGAAFPSLLFPQSRPARIRRDGHEDRSFARELNLFQVLTGIMGDREDGDLIADVFFATLRDGDAVRYRQAVFRDLDDLAVLDAITRFTDLMAQIRALVLDVLAMMIAGAALTQLSLVAGWAARDLRPGQRSGH